MLLSVWHRNVEKLCHHSALLEQSVVALFRASTAEHSNYRLHVAGLFFWYRSPRYAISARKKNSCKTLMPSSVDPCSTICSVKQEPCFTTEPNGFTALLWPDFLCARPLNPILPILPIKNYNCDMRSCSDTSSFCWCLTVWSEILRPQGLDHLSCLRKCCILMYRFWEAVVTLGRLDLEKSRIINIKKTSVVVQFLRIFFQSIH